MRRPRSHTRRRALERRAYPDPLLPPRWRGQAITLSAAAFVFAVLHVYAAALVVAALAIGPARAYVRQQLALGAVTARPPSLAGQLPLEDLRAVHHRA